MPAFKPVLPAGTSAFSPMAKAPGDFSSMPAPAPSAKMNADQFAQSIKAKYPAYASVDNVTLAQKMLAKYPEYADRVDMGTPVTPASVNHTPSLQNLGTNLAAAPGQIFKGAKSVVDTLGFGKTADTLGSAVANATASPRTKPLLPAPSKMDAAGAALNVGSLLFPVGAAERVGTGVAARVLPKVAARVVGKVAAGAAAGTVLDAGQHLEQGKAPLPGLNAALGAALPLPGAAKNAIKAGVGKVGENLAPRLINSLIKPLSKQFSYGKNPGRAVAQEGIVANSMEDLATKIGEARKSVGARLQTVADQVPGQLPLHPQSLLDPFEHAITKAVENNDQTLLNRLNQAKQAITSIFGTDKEGKIVPVGSRLLDNLSYAQAVMLKRKIGDLTKWTGQRTEDETVNGALTRTYGTLKDALNTFASQAAPQQAAQLRDLNERYANLTSAEIATKYRDVLQQRQNMINLPGKIGLAASAVAAPFTGGISTVLGAAGSIAADKVLSSPGFKTRAAAALAKIPQAAPKAERAFQSPGDLLLKAGKAALPKSKGSATAGTLLGAAAATGAAVAPLIPSMTKATNSSKPILQPKSGTITLPDRKVSLNTDDLDTLRKTLFAEISNRSSDKQHLEARTIINTALNRAAASGTPLSKVLSKPNQYQGYGSKEYKRLEAGKTGASDKQKLQAIDAIIEELKSGKFADNTDGRTFYHHNSDGSITANEKYPYK
jgi:hypothetical protein